MVNRGIKKYKAQKSGHFNVGVSPKTRGEYLMIGPRGYTICYLIYYGNIFIGVHPEVLILGYSYHGGKGEES